MVRRRQMLQDSILTIVRELIKQSESYEDSSKVLLKEFFNVFQHLTDSNIFIQALESYEKKYRYNNELGYYKISFLWFSVLFCEILRKKSIFSQDALIFALPLLRKVFLLLNSRTSIEDVEKWEKLQYECTEKLIPILNKHYRNELEIFYRIGTLVEKFGLGALNPRRLRKVVKPYLEAQKGQLSREDRIKAFFDLTGMRWRIRFYHPAFLVSKVFIYLKVKKSGQFNELFDFIKPEKKEITSTSVIYSYNKGKSDFIFGMITLPEGNSQKFKNFLLAAEKREIVELLEYQEIIDFQESFSLHNYQSNVGWQFTLQNFNKTLFSDSFTPDSPFNTKFSIGGWNKHWSCSWEKETLDYIKIYCKYWRQLDYPTICKLAGDTFLNQDRTKLFRPDTMLLWELFDQKIMNILVLPTRLRNSYFIEQYFLFPPENIEKEIISKILHIIPYSFLYNLQNGEQRIFAHLNPVLLNLIQEHLHWRIFKLRQLNMPSRLNMSFFDREALEFKSPKFLLDF